MTTPASTDIVTRVLDLWRSPLPEGADPLAAFRAVYADPLTVNGIATPLKTLAERAGMLRGALHDIEGRVIARIDGPSRVAFALRLTGTHAGPLVTPAGPVPATGKRIDITIIDIFGMQDGRVAAIWSVTDYLTLLIQTGTLAAEGTSDPGHPASLSPAIGAIREVQAEHMNSPHTAKS
jgi:predicted ester cyclase